MARTPWGVDTTVLKVTHDALITSILRYGLVLTGSGLPDDLLNMASRRITGLPFFRRVEALHFISGTRCLRNLYSQHCGVFLHSILLSHDSGLQM